MERLTWQNEKRPSAKEPSKRSTVSGQFLSVTEAPTTVEIRGAGHAEKLTTLGSSFADTSRAVDTTPPAGTQTTPNPSAPDAIDSTKDGNTYSESPSTVSSPGSLGTSTSVPDSTQSWTQTSSFFGPDSWPSGTADWSPELKRNMDTPTMVQIHRLRSERHHALLHADSERIAALNKKLFELTGKPGYQ